MGYSPRHAKPVSRLHRPFGVTDGGPGRHRAATLADAGRDDHGSPGQGSPGRGSHDDQGPHGERAAVGERAVRMTGMRPLNDDRGSPGPGERDSAGRDGSGCDERLAQLIPAQRPPHPGS